MLIICTNIGVYIYIIDLKKPSNRSACSFPDMNRWFSVKMFLQESVQQLSSPTKPSQ